MPRIESLSVDFERHGVPRCQEYPYRQPSTDDRVAGVGRMKKSWFFIENQWKISDFWICSVTVFLSRTWHIWSPRPNSVLVMDQWYIMSLHARNHHKWCLWCLMIILSRLAGFKPTIIDVTGTSPDGDEHPTLQATISYHLGQLTEFIHGF